MSDLQIPDDARKMGDGFGMGGHWQRRFSALVVAAELRRLASDCERRSDNVPLGRGAHESGAVDRVGNLREMAAYLNARADELDGGAK